MRFICVLTSLNASHNQLTTNDVLNHDKTSQVELTRTTVESHKLRVVPNSKVTMTNSEITTYPTLELQN